MITKECPVRLFTLCSGYDSQMLALDRLANDFHFNAELVGWSEIEENAINAHNALFPQYAGLNHNDMTQIDWNKVADFDILTYSTPCTSISSNGRQEGLKKGSGTASSLIWSVEDCIRIKRPRVLIMENVKRLVSSQFRADFDEWLNLLSGYGYHNYWQILNASHYGVAQARERVFCVSILDDVDYKFPSPIPLVKTTQDYLDKVVDNKYIYREKFLQNYHTYDISSKKYSASDLILVGNVFPSNYSSGKVYSIYGCSPTIICNGGTGMLVECYDADGKPFVKKLSPREMFRLMGVDDESIEKIHSVVHYTQALKKLAGNSIVVDCLYYIFKSILIDLKWNE